MFLSSLTEELCTKEENNKAGCILFFGDQCIFISSLRTGISYNDVGSCSFNSQWKTISVAAVIFFFLKTTSVA